MAPYLIGLYSPFPGCGKTTAANYLTVQHSYERISFAGTLKRLVEALLQEFYSKEEAAHLTYIAKNNPLTALDPRITSRHLQQTLGTEWGRQCVHPDLWLKAWQSKFIRCQELGKPVVVDDVRFENEAALIKQNGGVLWRINRPINTEFESTHISDGGLNDFAFDAVIENSGLLMDLNNQLHNLVFSYDDRS